MKLNHCHLVQIQTCIKRHWEQSDENETRNLCDDPVIHVMKLNPLYCGMGTSSTLLICVVNELISCHFQDAGAKQFFWWLPFISRVQSRSLCLYHTLVYPIPTLVHLVNWEQLNRKKKGPTNYYSLLSIHKLGSTTFRSCLIKFVRWTSPHVRVWALDESESACSSLCVRRVRMFEFERSTSPPVGVRALDESAYMGCLLGGRHDNTGLCRCILAPGRTLIIQAAPMYVAASARTSSRVTTRPDAPRDHLIEITWVIQISSNKATTGIKWTYPMQ
jgi:hypothetical protein